MDIGEAIHIMDVRRNDGTMLFSQRAAWDVIRPLVAPGSASANSAIRPCPYRIEERYADNGALSHYALVEVATGKEVWSQPE